MGFIQGFQPHRPELPDFPFPSLPDPSLFRGWAVSPARQTHLHLLQFWWPPHPHLWPLFLPGPWASGFTLLLALTGAEGLLSPARARGGHPSARGGSPWEEWPAGEGSLLGKRSWEVSQRELSADGFVISHKTGAFRFVNQSCLSRRMNVRFIGSKKALSARSGACLFEHGHSQDLKRVWAF